MSSDSPASSGRQYLRWLGIFFSGMCMGAADIVPGISGGTVAFVLGVYPQLIESIKSLNSQSLALLVSFRLRAFNQAVQWKFLLTLVSGIALSFVIIAPYLKDILGHEIHRVYLYSAFLGLILASVCFCAKQIKKWNFVHYLVLGAGAIIALAFTSTASTEVVVEPLYNVKVALDPTQAAVNYRDGWLLNIPSSTLSAMLAKEVVAPDTTVESVSKGLRGPAKDFVDSHSDFGFDLWIIACGAIAICAMLLPGISGSYLLTILGVYGPILAALADFIHGLKDGIFEQESFFLLASLAIGIILGAMIFSRVISWTLRHYHDGTIAALTGFMVGALGSVWPFWTYQYLYYPLKLESGPQLEVVAPVLPDWHSPVFLKACAFAVAGFLLVFLLERLAASSQQVRSTTPP